MSDPRLIMTSNGTRLQFVGGQPLMDDGLENLALISLFTSPGWCGNRLLKMPIGSDFERTCNQPITRQSLNSIRNAAERALNTPVFGQVTVTVANPVGHRLEITARIERGGRELRLTRNGQNWEFQSQQTGYDVVEHTYRVAVLDETAYLGTSTLG
jgi:phage gp46-like protein